MTVTRPPVTTQETPVRARPGRLGSVEVLIAVLVLAMLARGWLVHATQSQRAQTWLTIFVSIVIQASPFVVLGTVVSATIAAVVPPSFFARVLPRRPGLAVPVAGAAGVLMPGCECGSVVVSGALMRRGVTPAAALAFLLSAPAVNPVVLVSTSVAFAGRPMMIVARLVASMLTAVLMGWLWLRLGRGQWLRPAARPDLEGLPRAAALLAAFRADMTQAGGFLVIGAAIAATMNVLVPPHWLRAVAGHPALSVLAMASLAVVLSICSEADAFVAASLTQFSLTARLAFLVVGPMVDTKLIAMQVGTFGRRFAARFAPATFVVAILVATVVGSVTW